MEEHHFFDWLSFVEALELFFFFVKLFVNNFVLNPQQLFDREDSEMSSNLLELVRVWWYNEGLNGFFLILPRTGKFNFGGLCGEHKFYAPHKKINLFLIKPRNFYIHVINPSHLHAIVFGVFFDSVEFILG